MLVRLFHHHVEKERLNTCRSNRFIGSVLDRRRKSGCSLGLIGSHIHHRVPPITMAQVSLNFSDAHAAEIRQPTAGMFKTVGMALKLWDARFGTVLSYLSPERDAMHREESPPLAA